MSFIVLILLGNCWFVFMLIGHDIPAWFRKANKLAMLGAISGGLWLAALAVRNWLRREEN